MGGVGWLVGAGVVVGGVAETNKIKPDKEFFSVKCIIKI